jgi:hypothetical protein
MEIKEATIVSVQEFVEFTLDDGSTVRMRTGDREEREGCVRVNVTEKEWRESYTGAVNDKGLYYAGCALLGIQDAAIETLDLEFEPETELPDRVWLERLDEDCAALVAVGSNNRSTTRAESLAIVKDARDRYNTVSRLLRFGHIRETVQRILDDEREMVRDEE